jgi:lysozyme
MQPSARQKLRGLLIRHEQYRQFVYKDSTGHNTVGFGRNLDERGISQDEALSLLDDDIIYFTNKLVRAFPEFADLDDNRQIALLDMCFNLGVVGLLNFKKMLEFIKVKDWKNASQEILNSKAAIQCPERYKNLAEIMLTGEL